MAITWEKRRERSKAVAARSKSAVPINTRCTVPGCGQPTTAGAGKGLNNFFCRKHEDRYQRHGSAYLEPLTTAKLNPLRRAAFDWLRANGDKHWVRHAVGKVELLYHNGGEYRPAFRLRGLKPKDRARASWARLRQAEIDPRLSLAACLAVELALRNEAATESRVEFKRVQAAKVIHRLASGTHKRWEQERSDGRTRITELHKYPTSTGRVLRYIGEDIERAAEFIVQYHLSDIAAFMEERQVAGKLGTRAHPGRIKGVAKRARRPRPETPPPAPPTAPPRLSLSNAQSDDPEDHHRAIQEAITESLEATAASVELQKPGPVKVTLPDGTVVERK